MSMWSDIGEAKIFRTISGRAKVRVIREQDRKRRSRLIVLTAVVVIAAAAWQGWIAYQQAENEAPPLPLSERIRVSAPVFRPESIPPSTPSSNRKSESLVQSEIDSLVSGPLSRTPPPNLKGTTVAAKPLAVGPLQAGKPPPLAAIKSSKLNQANPQQPGKLSATSQPAVQHAAPHIAPAPPTSAAAPNPPIAAQAATPTAAAATQTSAATAPAAVQMPAVPLVKTDTSVLPHTDKVQPPNKVQATTVNEQPEVNARGTAIIYVDPEANAKP